ncbi:hypothetical protein GCM10009839_13910 [Catenulispora yoronensis]|uniref:Uncharacterized protein n=1 Tax=Catenulispora yoronensis TaxID=450799 RepID=A0ABP5F7W2_9ACTN
MATNLNWPRLQALWAPTGHIGYGPSAGSYELLPWVDVTRRLIGPWQINRGRQYELDQVTAGTWSGVLDNRDALFDPGNTGSAVAGQVVPYQPFRIRAQWPATANLLTPAQAIALTTAQANTSPGTTPDPTGCGWTATAGVSALTYPSSSSAFVGNYVLQAVAGAGASAWITCNQPATAGIAYSFQIRARITSGPALQLLPNIEWRSPTGDTVDGANGAPVTVGTAWTLLTVSGTAPAGTGFAVPEIAIHTAAATTLQLCAAQFEAAPAPTVFTNPGIWFPLFTGGIERYPQTWRQQGTLGFIQATAVDALALLAQSRLGDPFMAAAFRFAGDGALAPSLAYLLADPSGGLFLDSTGQRDPAQVAISNQGPGTLNAGVARTSATPAGMFICPPGATVVNIASSAGAGRGDYDLPCNMSYIQLPPSRAGITGPGATGAGFTRMIAFRVLAAPKTQSALWMATAAAPGPAYSYMPSAGLWVGPDLTVSAVLMDGNHQNAAGVQALGKVELGQWHVAFIGLSADGSTWSGNLDGAGFTAGLSPAWVPPVGGFTQDLIGAAAGAGGFGSTRYNLSGDVALAIEWPGVLSAAQTAAIVTAWRGGWAGDSTAIRFTRILAAATWNGPRAAAGNTTSMAAAVDLDGTDAASALQAVVDTEGGVMYCDAAGTMQLISRSARWNPGPATVVFGENTTTGEWPFADQPVFDFDPTLVTNLAEVTHSSTGLVLTAQDFISQRLNGVRDRQVSSQASDMQECQDKAAWLVARYAAPHTRVASLTAHPAAMPTMWPIVLGLDLGARAKAIRRPPAPAAPVVVDGWVENIAWSVDTSGDATVTYQISPADPAIYGFADTAVFDRFVFGY